MISDERLAQLIELQRCETIHPQSPTQWDLDVMSALAELRTWRKLTELADKFECVNIDCVEALDEYQISIEGTSGRYFRGDSITAAITAFMEQT